MVKLDKSDLKWSAAAIDFEGCIGINKFKRYDGYGQEYRYKVVVAVSMTTFQCLLKLWKMWGGHLYTHDTKKPNHRKVYGWSLQGSAAIKFLKSIYPYIVEKKDQTDLIVKNSEYLCWKKGRRYTDELLFIRNQLWQQLKDLHHKTILSQEFDSHMEQIKVQRLNGNPSQEVKIKSELQGNLQSQPEVVDRSVNRIAELIK